jgi:feruloyl esterase
MWVYQVANKNPAGVIPPAKYPAIHQAVVDQCDMLDGVKDGIIENPTRCRPRLEVLACKGDETNQCLTPAQIATATAIYAPPADPQTGRPVYPGMAPGTELGWAALGGVNAPYYASETFKYLAFNDPSWSPAERPINLGPDLSAVDRGAGPLTAMNPDLSAFFARGGKLIQVHGWTDNLIAPGDSVDYYTSVRAKVGARTTDQAYRLFMVPGMNHCAGGEGADSMDLQSAIESWVEKKQAPASVTASKVTNGEVKKTHLLCPYPQEAVYKGSGSIDEATSFACKVR